MIHNEAFANQLKEWRHQLHQNPEAAFEEVQTAKLVADRLKELGYQVHTGIGRTGVVATLTCGTGGRTIGFRADMDCICNTEQGVHPYTSRIPGRMHGCGHEVIRYPCLEQQN